MGDFTKSPFDLYRMFKHQPVCSSRMSSKQVGITQDGNFTEYIKKTTLCGNIVRHTSR